MGQSERFSVTARALARTNGHAQYRVTMIAMRSKPRGEYAVRLAVVAGGYYVAAQLGLRFAVVGDDVTPLWPPTGVAIVALLPFGTRIWPAIAVAAFAVNAPIGPSVGGGGPASRSATRSRRSPRALLLVRVGFRTRLDRVRDALALVFIGALRVHGDQRDRRHDDVARRRRDRRERVSVETWAAWWAGDAMGVLIVAPFLWSLRRPHFVRGALGPRARGGGAVRRAVRRVPSSPCGTRSISCSSCCHCSDGSRGDSSSAAPRPRRCSSPSS